MAQVNLPPGFELVEEAPASGLPPGFEVLAAPPEAPPQSSGSLDTAALASAAARNVPGAIRTAGRFVANHPSGVQKTLGAGMTALGGTIGAGIGSSVGGPTGAVVGALTGASVRGLTPTQAALREWGGRAAGEAPDVAKAAGRAVGIQEYIKNTSGLKVPASDILMRQQGLPAAENYAKSQGRELLKVLGPDGKVVAGPTAPTPAAKPRMGGRLLTKAAQGMGALGEAAKIASSPAVSAFLASGEVNRRLNSPETLNEIRELQLPKQQRTNQNPDRDRILMRLGEMLGL